MMMEKVTARVFRYDPSRDDKPRYETYDVPYAKDMRILDVLHYIQENYDGSLAFRYSCRRRRCGTCTVMVNSKPVLACFGGAEKEMTIEPLPNLPIIRDLVVDTERYEARINSIHPVLQRARLPLNEPETLEPAKCEDFRWLETCVECFACMTVCPAVDVDWEGFAGPATLVQLAKRALDPRDELERTPLALESGTCSHCVSCYACVEACPLKVDPLEKAIEKLKGKCAEQEVGAWAKFNKVFMNVIRDNGLVNPFILFRHTMKTSSLFSKLPLGIRFTLKRKITFRMKRVSKVEEIRKIYDLIGGGK